MFPHSLKFGNEVALRMLGRDHVQGPVTDVCVGLDDQEAQAVYQDIRLYDFDVVSFEPKRLKEKVTTPARFQQFLELLGRLQLSQCDRSVVKKWVVTAALENNVPVI